MMFLSNFILFLYIVPVSSNSATSHGIAKSVDTAVETITAAKELRKSIDSFKALNAIGPKASTLFKSFISIGSAVSQTLNLKPESDAYKILKDLNRRTQPLWEYIDSVIVTVIKVLGLNGTWDQYTERVTDQLTKLNEYSDKFLDPAVNKEDSFIHQFSNYCEYGDSSPSSILRFLRFHLLWPCENAQTDAQNIAVHRVQLMKVLLRLQVEDRYNPDLVSFLPEFLSINENVRKNLINEPLNTFTNQYKDYREAIHALFDELKEKRLLQNTTQEKCLLTELVTRVNFDHGRARLYAYRLHHELIKLSKLAGICAAVMFEDDAKAMEVYETEITKNVSRIAAHASQYLNDSLHSSWPHIHHGILKEIILEKLPNSMNFDEKQLKEVAGHIEYRLTNEGTSKFDYKVLIVPAEDENYEYYFEGPETQCDFNRGENGFDTVIGRFPRDQTSGLDMESFVLNMYKAKLAAKELNITIRSEMRYSDSNSTLSDIVDSLKKIIEKNNFLDHKFRCWAIVAERKSTTCSEIKYWSSTHNVVQLESITAGVMKIEDQLHITVPSYVPYSLCNPPSKLKQFYKFEK
ncbi:unnamed protein product [Caenorhabditis nigoni]